MVEFWDSLIGPHFESSLYEIISRYFSYSKGPAFGFWCSEKCPNDRSFDLENNQTNIFQKKLFLLKFTAKSKNW